MKHALALLTTLLLAQFVTACAAKPGSDRTKLDITYKTTALGSLRLDLGHPAAPEAGANFPPVVFTHDGGWTAGNKSVDNGMRKQSVKLLNAQGFCVASIDFRLCRKTRDIRIRDCVTDSKDALRFLAINAQQFSLDASRVFKFGDSAGGQIAQMLFPSPPESFPADPALADAKYRLFAGVSWYGPCDFEKTELFNPGDRIKEHAEAVKATVKRCQRNVLVLNSPFVREPVHYRHAWAQNPMSNIVNSSGVSLATQRSGDWLLGETAEKVFPPENMPEDAARRFAGNQIRRKLGLADLERCVQEAEATIGGLKPALDNAT